MTTKPLANLPYPLSLPAESQFEGRGHLRSDSPILIEANTDLEAVNVWLRERSSSSPQTARSYFLHVERFLLWCHHERQKKLSDVTSTDLSDYRDFLMDPKPEETWCGPRVSRTHPSWRPFQGALSPSSQQLSMTIIGSLFSFLCDAGYLRGNPMRLIKKSSRSKSGDNKIERFLHKYLLKEIADYIDHQQNESREAVAKNEQTRWAFILLVTLGLRREEVVTHTHDSFSKKTRPSGDQWWCKVTGKGDKERTIPVPSSTIEALKRYRSHLGLTPLPEPGDATPLVMSIRKKGSVSSSQLYRIITDLCRKVAGELMPSDPYGASQLEAASPHWLRHSYITSLGDLGVSLRHRRLSAGHSSMDTTVRYDHADDDQWYSDMQKDILQS